MDQLPHGREKVDCHLADKPNMKITYFKDTDTALLEFSGHPVEETREISENVYVDLDKAGNLVSMTIEHAAKYASLPRVSVQEIDVSTAEGVL